MKLVSTRLRTISYPILGLFTALLVFSLFKTPTTNAASASDWYAGNIIDDGVYYDNNSMSAQDIQNFLNSKIPSCDTNGSKIYSGNQTRAQYGASRGYPAPYICLRDFSQNGVSAANIIKSAADTYRVSPKTLLVMLQKEQSLVTDDWPWPNQYRSAMGYGCPDTAPCDSEYYGFYNQVTNAARQIRRYANYPDQYNYRPYRNNYIQYNPTASCGGSDVYIHNLATAGLYIYTPYQPNASALNNLYGSGDSCGAYGNRNFWRLFTDWFISVRAADYFASAAGQSDSAFIRQGSSSSAYMRFKNLGQKPWYDAVSAPGSGHPYVRLGTDLPLNRDSAFGSSWPWKSRAATTFGRVYNMDGTVAGNQHVAWPGQTVEFWFAFTAPYTLPGGTYQEGLRPIVEGVGAMNNTGTYINVTVQPDVYTAQYIGQSSSAASKQAQRSSAYISYKNTGNVAWYDETSAPGVGRFPVHLATDYPLNRNSSLSKQWPYPHRAAVNFSTVYEANGTTLAANQHVVQPGQIVKFAFELQSSMTQQPGFYTEALRPVVQGLGPMNDTGTWIGHTVQQAQYTAANAGQSGTLTISKGNSATGYVNYKNTGNVAWYDDVSAWSEKVLPVRLATDFPLNRDSIFGSKRQWSHRPGVNFEAVYEANGTTLAANQHVVQPGQIVKFGVYLTVRPSQASGFYSEAVRPIVEGAGPMNDTGTWLGVTVP